MGSSGITGSTANAARVRARAARVVAIGLVALLGLAFVAPGASAAETNTKYCDAVENLSTGNSGDSSAGQAKALAKSFKAAAASEPNNVKSAMNSIAAYYETLGDAGTSPSKLAAALGKAKKFAKATAKWSKYTIKTCSGI